MNGNRTVAFAMLVVLCGCGSVPQQLPRATQQDVASADDKTLCIAVWLYQNDHPDVEVVRTEYRSRLNANRFTHEQCKAFFSQTTAQRGGDAGQFLGYLLGNFAVGAAQGYGNKPVPAFQMPAPRPAQQTKPIGMPLIGQRSIYSNGVNQVLCDYGSGGQAIFPFGFTCPANYPY